MAWAGARKTRAYRSFLEVIVKALSLRSVVKFGVRFAFPTDPVLSLKDFLGKCMPGGTSKKQLHRFLHANFTTVFRRISWAKSTHDTVPSALQ